MASRAGAGFTLIELMVTIAIVAILAGIALPSYRDYVTRGRLVSATNALSAARVQMEQFYLDNRTYASGPCATSTTADTFAVVCASPTASAYTIKATGSGVTAGFEYTINQTGAMTSKLPTSWDATGTTYSCWVTKRGETC